MQGESYSDEEDDKDEKHIPTYTSLKTDAWMDAKLSDEDLKQMDPSGVLASRRENMNTIDNSMWYGFTETTVDGGDTSYCYMCENPRLERQDTGESKHYDQLTRLLRSHHKVTPNLATHWALRYYDENIFPTTRKAMTTRMFLMHMLKHDPDEASIHKMCLVNSLDLHKILRDVIKPVDDGDAPNSKTVDMMMKNNKEIRASLKAFNNATITQANRSRN